MKSYATVAALLSAVSAVLAQSGAVIQSPASLVQCQPVLLNWNGGSAPYYISVIPGGQASAAALKTFSTQTGNSLTWVVDLPVQEITLKIVDASGAINYSSPIPIQAGSDTSCVNGNVAASVATTAATTAATTSTQAAGRQTTSSSVRAPLSSSSSTGASTTSSTQVTNLSNTAPTAATTTGGAGKIAANVAGLVGVAALVAFFA